MAYTVRNYKTKKELKEAVKLGPVPAFQPGGLFPLKTGASVIEGPHGYHRWYAAVIIDENHNVVKVTG